MQADILILSMLNQYNEANDKAITVKLDTHEPFTAAIAHNGFHLDAAAFNVLYTYRGGMSDSVITQTIPSVISAEGQWEGPSLRLEFTLDLIDENAKEDKELLITGLATGTKLTSNP